MFHEVTDKQIDFDNLKEEYYKRADKLHCLINDKSKLQEFESTITDIKAKKESEVKLNDIHLQLEYNKDKSVKYSEKTERIEGDISLLSTDLEQIKKNIFSYAKLLPNRKNLPTKLSQLMDDPNDEQLLISKLGDSERYIKKVPKDKNKPDINNSSLLETQNDDNTMLNQSEYEISQHQDIQISNPDQEINIVDNKTPQEPYSFPVNVDALQAKLDFEFTARLPYIFDSQKEKHEENQRMINIRENMTKDEFWIDLRNDDEKQSTNLTWLDNLSSNVNMLLGVVDGMEKNEIKHSVYSAKNEPQRGTRRFSEETINELESNKKKLIKADLHNINDVCLQSNFFNK